MFAPRKKKSETQQAVVDMADKAAEVFPQLADLELGRVEGVSLRGLSISPNTKGEGFRSILRVRLTEPLPNGGMADGWTAGDYVVFAGGSTVFEAIAAMECALAEGTAELRPDDWGENTGAKANITRGTGRKSQR